MLRFFKNILSDRNDDYTFYRFNHSDHITFKENSGLYIHIPFCTHFCPYCPYIKIRFDKELAREYKLALIKEISLYHDHLGPQSFSSVYIGGGTPTLMIDELDEIFEHLHKHFTIIGNIAIETTPTDTGTYTLKRLRSIGFNLISLGIQTFNDHYLKMIGRDYDSRIALRSLDEVMDQGFDTVNLDLIFAIGDQSIKDIRNDLFIAITRKVNQVTCYPLFTFPYSEIGQLKKLRKVSMPGIQTKRKMYYFINEFLQENSYARTNVWSFINDDSEQFSSVTRDYYLGLGVASGSYNGEAFYFNTFSFPEYVKSVNTELPISIKMDVSKKMAKLFWIYWQLYKTVIEKKKYYELTAINEENDFRLVTGLFRLLGFIESEDQGRIRLNTKGSYWIHLIQNYYALNYVNKIWSASKNNAWPDKIKL